MPSDQYLLAPAIAMAAIGVLSLVLRWMSSDPTGRRAARRRPARFRADYGLLVPVATMADSGSAASLQQLLARHGIRATVAPAPGGGVLVLVFGTEESRARALLTPSG